MNKPAVFDSRTIDTQISQQQSDLSASCPKTLYCKTRIVNPPVLQKDGSLKHYADIDADYAVQIKGLPKFKQYGVALKAEANKTA